MVNAGAQTDDDIERLLTRWTLGNDAPLTLQDCPRAWQNALATQNMQQLPLAALAMLSQYQALVQAPQAATPLLDLPPLPTLPALTLPDYAQPWVDYIAQASADCVHMLLALLTQYGYRVSPATWLRYPAKHSSNEQVMAMYQPWQNWYVRRNRALTSADDTSTVVLNADTWADYSTAERLQLLQQLRLHDPDACRDLIAACIAQETAEKRLHILAVLEKKLSEDDLALLQSLSQDRSKKVVSLAHKLMARLGHGEVEGDKVALQEWVAMTKITPTSALTGTLAKAFGRKAQADYHITPKALRNGTQRAHYNNLLEQFGIVTLAKALGITVEQFVLGWDSKQSHHECTMALLNALAHLPDAYLALICTFIERLPMTQYAWWRNEWLWSRLPPAQQQRLFANILTTANDDGVLLTLLPYIKQPLAAGSITWAQFKRSSIWAALSEDGDYFASDCLLLGLIVPPSLAEAILAALLQQTQRLRVDPVFSSLRLNIALAKLNTSSATSHTGTNP